jgi:hypothetical protein
LREIHELSVILKSGGEMIKKQISKSIKGGVHILTRGAFTIKTAIVIAVLTACSPMCPATLTALNAWYESDRFMGFNEITMVATFRNDSSSSLTFGPRETFDLWIKKTYGDAAIPPVTINEEPSGAVPPDATFTYNVTIDVSGFIPSFVKLGFRGISAELGTMSPNAMPLREVSFACN